MKKILIIFCSLCLLMFPVLAMGERAPQAAPEEPEDVLIEVQEETTTLEGVSDEEEDYDDSDLLLEEIEGENNEDY